MGKIIGQLSGGLTIRGPNSAEAFTLTALPVTTVVTSSSNSSSTSTANDIITSSVTFAGVVTRTLDNLVVSSPQLYADLVPEIVVADTSVLTVIDGVTSYVGDGSTVVTVTYPVYGTRTITLTAVTSGPTTTVINHFGGFATGSLARAMSDSVLALIDGQTPSASTVASLSAYAYNQYPYAGLFTRNTGAFYSAVDLTCHCVGTTYDGTSTSALRSTYGPTLVSPIHGMQAYHVAKVMAAGTQYLFLDNSNNQIIRTVVATLPITPDSGGDATTDLVVVLFDAELPAGVSFSKVLPADYQDYMTMPTGLSIPGGVGVGSACDNIAGIPVLVKHGVYWGPGVLPDVDTCGPVFFCGTWNSVYFQWHDVSAIVEDVDPVLSPWYTGIHGGDSGGPLFAVLGTEPILLGVLSNGTNLGIASTGEPLYPTGDQYAWPSIADNFDLVNAAMHTLSVNAGLLTDYQLTAVDLSAYPVYT